MIREILPGSPEIAGRALRAEAANRDGIISLWALSVLAFATPIRGRGKSTGHAVSFGRFGAPWSSVLWSIPRPTKDAAGAIIASSHTDGTVRSPPATWPAGLPSRCAGGASRKGRDDFRTSANVRGVQLWRKTIFTEDRIYRMKDCIEP